MGKVAQETWPKAHYIMIAESAKNAQDLYNAGSHYVIRSALLCADRLECLLSSYFSSCNNELQNIFDGLKYEDKKHGAKSKMHNSAATAAAATFPSAIMP